MDERFEKWWSKQFKFESKHKLALDAWKAALESVKPKKRFGCFCCSDTQHRLHCVLDPDYKGVDICIEAEELIKKGKSKIDCPMWREIEG